ncbi:MAG: 3'(2'),5'-bisphosphate nucleotidase CysQ [Paracoccaceae bacterium]
MPHAPLLSALLPVAREAGARIMDIHARGVAARLKTDGSPVTEADDAAEAVILPALDRLAPGITVISEENTASHALAAPERFFLVDPLDGTKEFLKPDGKAFTVNIALVERGVPVAGVVFAPALNRMFWGALGEGAWGDDGAGAHALRVRPVPEGGRVAVASASHRDAATDNWLAAQGITRTVSIGSSLKFCLLAAAEADVYPRFGPTMEWDTAAGDAILRAAGGRVTTPDGTIFAYGKDGWLNGAFVAWGA